MPMSSFIGALLSASSFWTNPLMTRDTAVPLSAPNSAFDATVDFVGYGCESRSVLFYAGTAGNPSSLSQNLINEVGKRTGVNTIVRVGGTSLDHSFFNPNQAEAAKIPPDQKTYNVPKNITYGPSYFKSFNNLHGIRWILDLPLAYDNLSSAITRGKSAFGTIGAGNIFALEVGNEPDYYPGEDRPASYGPKQYAKEWGDFADGIQNALKTNKKFVALDLARGPVPTAGWSPKRVFTFGGLSKYANIIEAVSGHFYQTTASANSDLQSELMTHTGIANRIGKLSSPIQFLADKHPHIKYVLGEVGSALNPVVNGQQTYHYDFEAVLGAALWQVDMMLYSISVGVHRINMQLGIGFSYVPWQPVDWQGYKAAVRAPYYAQVFVADFIGKSGNTKIANIDQSSDRFAVYAAYDGGVLSRVAAINFELWTSSDGTKRPVRQYTFNVPNGVKTVTVKKLTSPKGGRDGGAPDSGSIAWAGEQWSIQSNGIGKQVRNDTYKVQTKNGKATISVKASEAVMAFLD